MQISVRVTQSVVRVMLLCLAGEEDTVSVAQVLLRSVAVDGRVNKVRVYFSPFQRVSSVYGNVLSVFLV